LKARPRICLEWAGGLAALLLTSCAHQQAGFSSWPSLTPEQYGRFSRHFLQVQQFYPEPRWFNYVSRIYSDNFLLRVVRIEGRFEGSPEGGNDGFVDVLSIQADGKAWANWCERPSISLFCHVFTATEVQLSSREMNTLREQLGKLNLATTPTDFSPDLGQKRAAVIFRKSVGGDIVNHECIGDLPPEVAAIIEPIGNLIRQQRLKWYRSLMPRE